MDNQIFVDTCAFADEITPVIYTLGLIKSAVVLRSVSLEMTKLHASDHPGKHRAGEQALVNLALLHSIPGVEVIMDGAEPMAPHPDDDLLKRAELVNGRIFTADTSLQQTAREQQIQVIAVQQYRDLLRAVAPTLTRLFPPEQHLTPGTVITIPITKLGNKPGQGISFLPDRRMVVIDGGQPHLGGELCVEITGIRRGDTGPDIVFAVPAAAERIETSEHHA